MKKKINIIYLLFMLFLVLLNYITKNSNILNLVLSSSLSILLYNIFSELNIKSTLEKYKNKYKIYKITIIFISLLFIVFSALSFLIGDNHPLFFFLLHLRKCLSLHTPLSSYIQILSTGKYLF